MIPMGLSLPSGDVFGAVKFSPTKAKATLPASPSNAAAAAVRRQDRRSSGYQMQVLGESLTSIETNVIFELRLIFNSRGRKLAVL